MDSLIGKIVGNGCEVIEYLGKNKRYMHKWLVKCKCGIKFETRSYQIINNKVTSCRKCITYMIAIRRAKKNIGLKFNKLQIVDIGMIGKNKETVRKYKCLCDCGQIKYADLNSLKVGSTVSCGCGKIKDIAGQTFGKLQVLEFVKTNHKQARWKCKCSCGNIVIINGNHLRMKRTKSCGRCDERKMIGRKYGRLTVVEFVGMQKNKSLYLCECECGITKEILGKRLKSGHTKSCGCIHKEMVGEAHHNWNPNLTDEDRNKSRSQPEYILLRQNVFKRDNYTCQITGKTRCILNMHHINGYSWDIKGRLDPNNCITISEKVHKEFHNIYGRGKNTKKQFLKFLEEKEYRYEC